MKQDVAEKKIRGLQKEFLTRIEAHEVFLALPPELFNNIRKRVFRGTFDAYRLGVVGLDGFGNSSSLYGSFFGWLEDARTFLTEPQHKQVVEMCFGTALEAYRIGAMVAASRF